MHSFRGSSRKCLIYTTTGFHNNKTFETTHDETFLNGSQKGLWCVIFVKYRTCKIPLYPLSTIILPFYVNVESFFIWNTGKMCAYSAKKCTHGKTYEGYHKSRMSFQHLTRKIWTWNKVAWRESQQERKTAPEKLKRCSKVYKTTLNRMAFWNNLCWLVLIITYLFFVTFLCLEHWVELGNLFLDFRVFLSCSLKYTIKIHHAF